MILIDVEPLYKKFCELEEQARKDLMYYSDHYSANESDFFKWSAILTERTAYKYDLQDAPRVDAVPVVRCKDCKNYYLVTHRGIQLENGLCSLLDDRQVLPDEFCVWGENKEEDEDK